MRLMAHQRFALERLPRRYAPRNDSGNFTPLRRTVLCLLRPTFAESVVVFALLEVTVSLRSQSADWLWQSATPVPEGVFASIRDAASPHHRCAMRDCQPVGSYPCIRAADVFNEVVASLLAMTL
jgi:hypothetical protein